MRLGIASQSTYSELRVNDPRLPVSPELRYHSEWIDWDHFLADRSSERTLDASDDSVPSSAKKKKATQRGSGRRSSHTDNMTSWDSWGESDATAPTDAAASPPPVESLTEALDGATRNAEEDSGDSANPSGQSEGLAAEAATLAKQPYRSALYYPDLATATHAVRALGIRNRRDYAARRSADPRLPSQPHQFYSSVWIDWKTFLGKATNRGFYPTLAEAKVAARKLGARTAVGYRAMAGVDSKLPKDPMKVYADDWRGYPDFLGTNVALKEPYATFEDASAAAVALGIMTSLEYHKRYREDPRLRASPNKHFDNWPGWDSFLSRIGLYRTLEEFQAALQELGITTFNEFKARYKEDPRLPANPYLMYKGWTSWPAVLGGEKVSFYPTIEEASEAAQRLGFKLKKDYLVGYKADPKLPSNPTVTYKREWGEWGWDTYLGTQRRGKYPTYAEAAAAAQRLCIKSLDDYNARYALDPSLPSTPNVFYKESWQGIKPFLLPTKCSSLSDVKQYVRVLGLSNSIIYRKEYKKYPALPSNPQQVFKDEWVDWYDLCDMPRPYSYHDLADIVQSEGIKGASDYKKFRTRSEDPRIPSEPQMAYPDEWINWASFLGKVEPYVTKNIRVPYLEWAKSINAFSDVVRGGSSKAMSMCKFVRHHIQSLELSERPEVFFADNQLVRSEFVKLMEDQGERGGQGILLKAVSEFADYIIKERLSSIDPETGEVVVALGAVNPFHALAPTADYGSNVYGETSKPALTYSYVQGLRQWILPKTANSFSDLLHLHVFESDWYEIDPTLIDRDDPDCVYKIDGGKTKIWTPMSWLHTYALASVPARGRQLGYNDSGEADAEIPDYVDGKIVWVKNPSKMAGKLKRQGFVKRYKDDNFGMYFTSNKSSIAHSGYDVAWMPLELAKWMIKLRKWQSKYNPISRPTPWSECRRTELNTKQLAAKGANCFLFRDFRDVEVCEFTSKLKPRVACALYYSQPAGVELASLGGNPTAITLYTSEYTPHTMRVSLITAFIVEFGLPIDIVMKLAGHSSVVISIYYVKMNSGNLRKRFDESEKIALLDSAKAEMYMIEQKRLDEIRHRLIANLEDGPMMYQGQCAPGSVLVRDQGFCPMAGARCHDGGLLIGKTRVRAAVVSGYMGAQNCIRCRHFVSGPAFMGGLLATANEISLATNFQYEHYAELEDKVEQVRQEIDDLLEAEYLAEKSGEKFDSSGLSRLHVALEKSKSESERVAMKLAELLTDMQYVSRLIKQCHVILQDEAVSDGTSSGDPDMQLILQPGHEVQLALTETSRFHLLNEVCENAEIYESSTAVMALPSRSQLLDRMMGFNKIWPVMSRLTSAQQLSIGNQLTKFLYHRLKSHERVDLLMEGTIKLRDLSPDEQITQVDLEQFFKPVGLRLEGESLTHGDDNRQELIHAVELEEEY